MLVLNIGRSREVSLNDRWYVGLGGRYTLKHGGGERLAAKQVVGEMLRPLCG